jgi:pimeloyl-ACP methyl ester carboxylesterase
VEERRRVGNLAYERRGSDGPGDRPTVVLVHGIPGCSRGWHAVADLLAPDCDVLVPDLLGFGDSARPRDLAALHAEAQADALACLLDELRLRAVTLVGHDFGGPTGVLLAARRPDLVGALAVFAGNMFTDTPIPPPLNTVTWPLVGRLTSPLLFSRPSLAMVLRTGTGVPKPRLDIACALGDAGQTRAIRTIFHGSLTRLAELYRPVEDALARVEAPTVVGWGSRDPFFPVAQGQRTADALRARFLVYEGAGHSLPEERPAEVAATIRELVTTRGGARKRRA